jgi:hypothetical protein
MKLTSQLLLGGLAACILTLPLAADTTYTYTGSDYNYCPVGSPYASTCGSHFMTITFVLADPLGDNLDEATTGDISANDPSDIISWSFTDQSATISSALGNLFSPASLEIDVSTDGSGAITDSVLQAGAATVQLEAFNSDDYTYSAVDGVGENLLGWCVQGDCTTHWSVSSSSSPVPEPGNVALIGLGLAAIGLVRRKLQQRNQPAA